MNSTEKKTYIALVAFFLVLIFTVPIIQAVVEYKRDRRIQAFDLLVDMTTTPYLRARQLHELAGKSALYADSLDQEITLAHDTTWDPSRAIRLLDEALVVGADLKRAACTINRHIALDSSLAALNTLDSLTLSLSNLLSALQTDKPGTELTLHTKYVQAKTQQLVCTYKAPGLLRNFILACANLRYIFWNDRYLRPYEKEMENNSVFAQSIRPAMQFLRYSLFQDLGEKGVSGRSGWFFYKPDVNYVTSPAITDKRYMTFDPNGKRIGDDPVKTIKGFQQQLATMGIDLLMVIVPTKASIYPELLNPAIPASLSGKVGNSPAVIAQLRAEGVEAVDLFSAFAAERKNDIIAGDSLYLSKDTHWRSRGVTSAARVVADRIRQYPWYQDGSTEYVVDTVSVERIGDVATMTTLPAFRLHDLSLCFTPEKVTCYQVSQLLRDTAGTETARVLYKDEYRRSPILLLGDSYSRIYQTDEPRSAGWIAHLSRELKQPISSLVNDGGASTLVRQSLARRPNLLKGKKLVVWEVVERDLRYGEEGWKEIPIALQATH